MITLKSGERGYICRKCMRFVSESQQRCECNGVAVCKVGVCGGCLVGMPLGTGLHTFGDGCRFRESDRDQFRPAVK